MRNILVGLIVGLLIGTAGTALASSDFIQAKLANFNMQVGDDEVVMVEAVVIDGVSNYPIRVIADLSGHDVDYIDDTRLIKLNKKQVLSEPIKNEGDNMKKDPNEITSLEGLENLIKINQFRVLDLQGAIRSSNRDREEYPDLPVDERIEEWEAMIVDIEVYIAELELRRIELEAQQ